MKMVDDSVHESAKRVKVLRKLSTLDTSLKFIHHSVNHQNQALQFLENLDCCRHRSVRL